MIFTSILLVLIGITLLIFGYLIWKKEKISLLHDYHYENVSEKDRKIFCALSGAGIVLCGSGIIITGLLIAVTSSPRSFIAFAAGFSAGIALLIYAGRKYNRKK